MSISKQIVESIKNAVNIIDVIENCGIQLYRKGANYECLCPFHEDKNLGSFVVNARNNYYKCFSCGASGDSITFLMKYNKMSYTDALRYIASIYGIYVDAQPAPTVIKREPRKPMPPRKLVVWSEDIMKAYLQPTNNVLLTYLFSLPMPTDCKERLQRMVTLYKIGTARKGYTEGWTMFPQIDMEGWVHDVKFMDYLPDGHRNKAKNPTWMKAMLAKAGRFDDDKCMVKRCLFGLHLAKIYQKAEICLVESEKTALICSAFCDPTKKIWMACGGLSNLKSDMLEPLIRDNRYIVVYPDKDGEDKWRDAIKAIGYARMSMTEKMKSVEEGGLYNQTLDSPKADIADILIRLMNGIEETEAEVVARRLGVPDKLGLIQRMMDRFKLTIID